MKKKVLGLLMAAVLCLCLLPVGAGADGTTAKVKPDTVDTKNGSIIMGDFEANGPVLTSSDTTLSRQYYIVQNDVTIEGNLTVDGNEVDCALVLCQGATLTVNGALIHNGGDKFYIYGQSNGGDNVGKLIIKNSKGDGAAIQSTSGTPTLHISGGELEIHRNGQKFIDGVTLSSTYHIHKGTLDGEPIEYSAWTGSTNETPLTGSKLVLEYCNHKDASGESCTDYAAESDGSHHHKYCTVCGFKWPEVACSFTTPAYGNYTSDGHYLMCSDCGTVSSKWEVHDTITAPTDNGKGHTTRCRHCAYTAGDTVESHDTAGKDGACSKCGFKPVAYIGNSQNPDALYDSLQTAFIMAKNGDTITLTADIEPSENITFGEYRNDDGEWVKPGYSVTLVMGGHTLYSTSSNAALDVAGGTLTIADAAKIMASDNCSVAAIEVEDGNLIFKNTLNATGGSGTSNAAPAIEVTGGKVTFEGDVTATGGLQSNGGSGNLMYCQPAVYATGGELDFKGDLDLNGGLTITGSATLTNKLTQGKFWVKYLNDNGEEERVDGYRVSVAGSTFYTYAYNLLENGYAFAVSGTENSGTIQYAGRADTEGNDVTIISHTHFFDPEDNYTCVCNESCDHSAGYQDGKCKTCNKPCSHRRLTFDDRECLDCGQRMVARIGTKNSQNVTIYFFYSDLATALNAAKDGETVTLLDNVAVSRSVDIYDENNAARTITLDLNGKNINGSGPIWIGKLGRTSGPPNYTDTSILSPTTLIIKGSGDISGSLQVAKKATLNLTDWTSGTINTVSVSRYDDAEGSLIVGENSAHINNLWCSSGPAHPVKNVKLSGGTYGEIMITMNSDGSILFSSMLEEGYAFQYVDSGNFVDYSTKAVYDNGGLRTIYNVKVVKCTNHVDAKAVDTNANITDGTDDKCDYCNADLTSGMAATLTTGGKTYYYADLPAALKAASDKGGTVTLLQDVENVSEMLVIEGNYPVTLDLNGKKITGSGSQSTLLGVSNLSKVTICDSSESKAGQIKCTASGYAVYVSAGCDLTIESGTFAGADSEQASYAVGVNDAKLIIKGGTFNSPVVIQTGGRAEISGGTFASLQTQNNATIGSLLEKGCGFKTMGENSRWLTEEELKETTVTKVTATPAPIQSLTLKTVSTTAVDEDGKPVEVSSTMAYGTTGNVKLAAQIVDGGIGVETKWYKVSGEETELTNAAKDNTYPLPADLSAGTHTYRVTATANGYTKTVDISVTVTPIDLSSATVTLKLDKSSTNPSGWHFFSPKEDGTGDLITQEIESVTVNTDYGVVTLDKDTDYVVVGNEQKNAGDYRLHIGPTEGNTNIEGKSGDISWRIRAFVLSMPEFKNDEIKKPYDGTTDLAADAIPSPNHFKAHENMGYSGTISLTADKDYVVKKANYNSADVGDKKCVTCEIELKNSNYQFGNGMICEIKLDPNNPLYYVPAEIVKADAPTATETGKLEVVNKLAKTYTFELSGLIPAAPKGSLGEIGSYTLGDVSLGAYYTDGATVENGVLTLPINAVDSKNTGSIGTVTVKVATQNYKDITLTVNVSATNKIIPTGEPTLSSDKLTYGEKLSAITLSGKLHDDANNKDVEGTFEWADGTFQPTVGDGTYSAAWKFTPTDKATYAEATGTVSITVNKATPSGAPAYTKITSSGKTLKDAALKANSGWPEGTIQWVGADGKELPADTEVKANTAYKWVFTPTDGDNYNTATGSITLYSVSTGGGSSSGSTTTKTETTKNPDGSVTKTETRSDGTVIETTTNPDGSVSKTESKTTTKSNGSTVETVTETNTNADGSKSTSKTETTTNKDGSKTETKTETKTAADGTKSETKSETKTDANGVTNGKETTKTTAPNGSTGTTTTTTENGNSKTEAETKISNKAVEDAKKSGEAVKVPTEVKAGEDSNSAPTVKVELPKNAGETKIEIPVEDANSGTVAVIVHPDGTEEIVKDSVPTKDGVQLTVDGSATIKIIDNSKDFIDTRDHWSRDEVNFVVARELFNGVGNDLFGVNQPMTRGMVNTVLARLAGVDTTPSAGQKWYEVGTAWAKANGISDGTNPEASVTREQLATLLYRFSGTPEVNGDLLFNDAHEVSDYAQNALLWAMQNGILNGVGNNRVAPGADAQRAQVAAMMARYLKNVG